MSELVFEANDFVFNRGTVTWSASLDNSRVQRRAVQASHNHRMRLRIGICQIAGNLWLGDTFGREREPGADLGIFERSVARSGGRGGGAAECGAHQSSRLDHHHHSDCWGARNIQRGSH